MSKINRVNCIIKRSIPITSVNAPQGAKSCNYVEGCSKNGPFEILSFKDSNDKLVSREFNYFKNGHFFKVFYQYCYWGALNKGFKAYQKVDNKDFELKELDMIIFDDNNKNEAWKFNIHKEKDNLDLHKISYLTNGKKAQSVTFETAYDGNDIKDVNINNTVNKNLKKKNRKYLPLITSNFLPNVDDKIKLISEIMFDKYKLKDFMPPVKRVEHALLQSQNSTYNTYGDCNILNGEIRISDESYTSLEILEILSHEAKHASDASKCIRLDKNAQQIISLNAMGRLKDLIRNNPGSLNFINGSCKKGIIRSNSKGGARIEEICRSWDQVKTLKWEDRSQEIRANRASEEELKNYKSCYKSLEKLFKAKFSCSKFG